jgi:hypothetical protein
MLLLVFCDIDVDDVNAFVVNMAVLEFDLIDAMLLFH